VRVRGFVVHESIPEKHYKLKEEDIEALKAIEIDGDSADDADAEVVVPPEPQTSGAEPAVPEEAPVEVEEIDVTVPDVPSEPLMNVTDTATIDELERQIAVLEKMKAEREAEEE